MDPAQARAEAVVAAHEDRRAPLVGQLDEEADRAIQAAQDLGRGVVPLRGRRCPVSSTFRYRQARCWNGSRFWNWTISADQSGT